MNNNFNRYRLLVIVALVPLVAACASGGRAASSSAQSEATAVVGVDGTQTLTVKGTEMQFTPTRISVKAGQPVQLTFENDGHVVHDFTLAQGVATRFQTAASGGQQTTGTFAVTAPGTYTFVCAQPGHESAGMKGTLIAS
jgi:uncharacterized cupredoxin-like copper-binding protein